MCSNFLSQLRYGRLMFCAATLWHFHVNSTVTSRIHCFMHTVMKLNRFRTHQQIYSSVFSFRSHRIFFAGDTFRSYKEHFLGHHVKIRADSQGHSGHSLGRFLGRFGGQIYLVSFSSVHRNIVVDDWMLLVRRSLPFTLWLSTDTDTHNENKGKRGHSHVFSVQWWVQGSHG
jgi:hypothetical protein